MTRVAVVGGGLAGLVAARHLAAAGADVTVYERNAAVGGRVRSTQADGYTFDRGFQVLFTDYPAVRRELDLPALELWSFKPGAVLARPGERSVLADPLQDLRALTPSLFNTEVTMRDKLRVLRLRWELTRTDVATLLGREDATIEESLRARGFSEGFIDSFARPFYGGITLDRSLSSARFAFEYATKMLVEGSATVPNDGMGAITAQLAERATEAGATIETETPVTTLTPADGEVTLEAGDETVSADVAVVATDPKSARGLTGIDSIPTKAHGCVTQYFSLPKRQQLDAGRRLLLNAADARPNTVAVLSDVAPSYAPQERHLLSATFLGDQAADDDALAEEVREALASWYPENQFRDLELLRTDRIEFAQLAQPPGARETWPDHDDPEGPVVLAGEYTRWSSIQGALESGKGAAELAKERYLD